MMKNSLLFLTLFGCVAVATVQAQNARNNNAPVEMGDIGVDIGGGGAGVGVDVDGGGVGVGVGGDGYYDGEGYYDDGYYDDGVVWTGPGQYYGNWYDNESDYVTWRRNYYRRDGRRAYGDGRGYNRGGDRGYRGGEGRGGRGGRR